MNLFKDDSPLVNLGYTTEQKVRARRALRSLEEQAWVTFKPNPVAVFGYEEEQHALIRPLKLGGMTS